jgi:uncharacterized protein (DUF697 family)
MTERIAQAEEVTRTYAMYSAGAGLIPVPFADLAALAALQVKMVLELSELYDLEPDQTRTKALVTSLLTGAATFSLFHGLPGQIVASVPLLNVVGVLWKPFVSAAITYGVGNVFITHFERGGSFANLDVSSSSTREAFEAGARRKGKRPTKNDPGTGGAAPTHSGG